MAAHKQQKNPQQSRMPPPPPPPHDVAVVMVPLPAQGHLNQLLHLSIRLSSLGLPVHYAASATHLRQARLRLHHHSAAASAVHFHELPVPPFDNPPPNPAGPTRFPSQIMPSLDASLHLRSPILALVSRLSSAATLRRVAVVYDSLMSHAVQDLAALPNVELFIFRSISAFSVASWEPDILPQLPLRRHVIDGVPSLDGYYPPSFAQFLALQTAARTAFSGEIYNSCREIEGFALDPLEGRMRREGKRFFAAGPFNPVGGEFGSGPRHRCLDWLDRQAAGTVVLVSFGTTCSFTEEQVGEVAKGLERSGQSFVWVVREADRADIFAAAAAEGGGGRRKNGWEEGFEERVRDRGILVRDWAPQLQILAHPSTGGFVSHCGWNSCLESISMGVPMATWAQHSDQPANAALITKVLNVGVEIKKWTREDELVPSRTIEMAVRKLMSSSDIRKNAAELGKIVRRSVMEGGTSRKEMDAFISHIRRS